MAMGWLSQELEAPTKDLLSDVEEEEAEEPAAADEEAKDPGATLLGFAMHGSARGWAL
jgi:hypothetical protein